MDKKIKFETLYNILREISASLNSGAHVKDVLEALAMKSAQMLNAKGALIRILNPETKHLELGASYGLSDQYLSKGPALRKQFVMDLCRQNRVLVIKDIFNDPFVQYPKEAWTEGIRMMIDVPITYNDDVLGILRIYFDQPREFSEEELQYLILIAERGAAVIQKAQLLEFQESRYDQLALQTEKLSALGRMAAGIAHEINNPLADNRLWICFPRNHYRLESVEPERRNYTNELAIAEYTGQFLESGQHIGFITVLVPHGSSTDASVWKDRIRLVKTPDPEPGLSIEINTGKELIQTGIKCNLRLDMIRDYRRPKYTYESGRIVYDKVETNGDFFITRKSDSRLSYTVVNVTKMFYEGKLLFEQKKNFYGLAFDGGPFPEKMRNIIRDHAVHITPLCAKEPSVPVIDVSPPLNASTYSSSPM